MGAGRAERKPSETETNLDKRGDTSLVRSSLVYHTHFKKKLLRSTSLMSLEFGAWSLVGWCIGILGVLPWNQVEYWY